MGKGLIVILILVVLAVVFFGQYVGIKNTLVTKNEQVRSNWAIWMPRPISIEILSSLRLQEIGVAAAYGVMLTALSAAAFFIWGEKAGTA